MTDRDDGERRRRERAERVFFAALERPLGERAAFVAERCRGDSDLEVTVRSLLEAHARTGPLDRMRGKLSHWRADLLADEGESHAEIDDRTTLMRGPAAGDRYRIEALLGRGGMGEVWRAYDLKLRLDIALKWLRTELVADELALELLRREVRAAREVISPNVCRVFDLQEIDGRELIAMEYVEGTSLRAILDARGPLELQEAREIASQFLAGLAAIHDAGLVHRDIKPDNLMITHAGRVVVMDFGIAKGLTEGRPSTIAGTLAYMAPEQLAGGRLDGRSDIFAAGVVLAEMVDPAGVRSREAREAVWARIHQGVPEVSATPWSKVIARAVAPNPEHRYGSASAMARAIEEVTLRAVGDEEARPYPGLAVFEREDAEFFFGRELEVEALWRKLRPARLLAVTGASGAGKSSFLRAGLLPSLPASWSAVLATPGNRPFVSLARALAEVLPGDPGTVDSLLRFEEPAAALELVSRWRRGQEQCLVVLDQFEELFTQNPIAVQASFADLLGKVPLEADVHVLLSLRDDFLLHCRAHAALSPIFSELTPLGPPTGAALRRAIVQPALKCGYRFEDEALVEEMLAQVEGERGSLPMAAFAAAELWQLRDREHGLLTREAYQLIGGVSGALAQHAERTLDRIGEDRVPIVRELFRNLVTAKGTRAARSRYQLLSVFAGHADEAAVDSGQDREAAAEVLDTLIDARLLTSYEVPGEEEDRQHRTRIEIVHESLLTSWPRLERWHVQEADSARLRDQLRQAAQAWLDRGRPVDLLWSGTSYQEFQIWCERYPGGLSRDEQEFAAAMTTHAERRKRRRRAAVAAAFAVLLAVLAVVFASRQEARQQALRAEANQLLALGRVAIEDDPTAALAYALASLERADNPVTRLFALEVLGRGPASFFLERPHWGVSDQGAVSVDMSPDGRWLAAGYHDGSLRLWPSNGGAPRSLERQDSSIRSVRFGPDSDLLVSRSHSSHEVTIWSVLDGRPVRRLPTQGPVDFRLAGDPARLFTFTRHGSQTRVESWPLGDGGPELHGDLDTQLYEWGRWLSPWGLDIDSRGTRLAYRPLDSDQTPGRSSASEIRLLSLDTSASTPPKRIETHSGGISGLTFHPDGRHLASTHEADIRIWDLDSGFDAPERVLSRSPGRAFKPRFDSAGSKLTIVGLHAAVWDLEYPPEAEPLLVRNGSSDVTNQAAFDPHGRWLATGNLFGVSLWPIERRYPLVLKGHEKQVRHVAFLPDGESLASVSLDRTLRLWPLSATGAGGSRVLFDAGETEGNFRRLKVGSSGSWILTALGQSVWLVPLDGSPPRKLGGFSSPVQALALGERTAVAHPRPTEGRSLIRVWDLETGEARNLDLGEGDISDMQLAPGGRLVTGGSDGTRVWNLEDGSLQTIFERAGVFDLSRDGRLLLVGSQGDNGEAVLYDLEQGTSRQLDAHGSAGWVALDPGGGLALTTGEGQVRIGPTTGEPPHVLVVPGSFLWPAVSPDGRWITALDNSETITLWPVPDLSQLPLHTLPHAELLAKLRSLTNLRIVADSESSTGWDWEIDPFPGWEEVPTW